MEFDEIDKMTTEQLEERKSAIVAELEKPDADLDALEKEARAIKEELEKRKNAEAKRQEIRNAVASGAGAAIGTPAKAETRKTVTMEEVRSSEAYINAFADYIKTGDDRECRKLLTENVSGTVPVPSFVDEIIQTAWEQDQVMSRIRKTNIKGNLKVPFEKAAGEAAVHTEGTDAPDEESLTIGIVTMIPANIKKWIRVSDEAVAMGGEGFVRYIYEELTHQIIKKEAALAVNDIATAPAAHSNTQIGVPKVTAAPAITTIPTAAANLSDEAVTPVVILNRLTEVDFLAAHAAGNFAVDPFAGLPRVYTSALKAYSAAAAGEVYAIVGDLAGEQFNYPEGDGVVLKYDDMSEAEADLVKIVGRKYAAHAVTAPGRFCNIAKPNA